MVFLVFYKKEFLQAKDGFTIEQRVRKRTRKTTSSHKRMEVRMKHIEAYETICKKSFPGSR